VQVGLGETREWEQVEDLSWEVKGKLARFQEFGRHLASMAPSFVLPPPEKVGFYELGGVFEQTRLCLACVSQ
jgi:hypothetical protein